MSERIDVRAWLCGLLLATLACGVAPAQEPASLLAAIFADHAVLQRDRPIDVWGMASAGEQITVTLAGATRKTQADARGRWAVVMPPLPAGGPYTLLARTPSRAQQVNDLLVGDVWLCSGQSNMEFKVRSALNAGWEVAHSANETIRHVAIPRNPATAPGADFPAPLEWKVAGPATTGEFSAVCYYFVRELQKSVSVPQGMIHSSWGGTRIEEWLSVQSLQQLGGNEANLARLAEYAGNPALGTRHWGEALQQWWSAQAATRGTKPWMPAGATGDWQP
ncbi:MAG TPA: hypothetical protein VFS13_10955, partial [Steroidobacteraceae bacterium]|nr:hypothetical protein [Steroidobacteraceae bacterium]